MTDTEKLLKYYSEYTTTFAWAIDFCRALYERPLICKLLLRIVFGKYAYREFVGLVGDLEEKGHPIGFGYGLEGCEYQKEKVPLMWWITRLSDSKEQ